MAASPTQRTLETLRKEGWMAQVVEKRIPFRHVTQDLFGCIDILAVKKGEPVLGVQATTRGNQAARYHKSVALVELANWLDAGCTFEVWGWAKVGAAGKRKLWEVTRRNVHRSELSDYK